MDKIRKIHTLKFKVFKCIQSNFKLHTLEHQRRNIREILEHIR